MKKFSLFLVLAILFMFTCSEKSPDTKLAEGTPEYQLAEQLSSTLAYLDPAENNVLISSNEFNITTGEVIGNIQRNMGNRANQLTNLNESQLKSNIKRFANILGEKELFLTAAEKEGIQISQTEIDSALNIQYSRAGGKEKFSQFLSNRGLNIEDVKKDIADGLKIQKYIDTVVNVKANVTEEDIQEAYNEAKTVTVRHILLNTQGKSDSAKEQIKEKMEDIHAKAKGGADFAELAREYSEDPGSKNKGGLYENIERGQMVKEFEDAAFSVPIGAVSDIFETRYGYHILTVVDRKKESKPLEDVEQRIGKKLRQQNYQEAYQELLADLKDRYEYNEVEF